jgi:hypothetical protein
MHQTTGTESRQGAKRGSTRRLRLLAVGLSTALPLLAFVPAPAGAAPAPNKGPAPLENCVIDVVSGSTTPAAERCFPNFTEAMRYATKGAITNAPATAAEAVKDPAFNALLGSSEKSSATREATAAAVVLEIGYDLVNYGGASVTFTGSGGNCTTPTTNIDYQINISAGWQDRISSYRTYSNCWANHYTWSNYVSPSTGYLSGRPSMSPFPPRNFDNDARSIRWS